MHPANGGRLPVDKRLEQIDRIVNSRVFRNSDEICNLLKFLARHSVEAPEIPLSEQQIAAEILGRSADFDPSLDSTVRTQMNRLRTKLFEYYSSVGRNDPILVEIPKNSQSVSFRERGAFALPQAGVSVERPRVAREKVGPWKLATICLTAVVIALAGIIWTDSADHPQSAAALASDPLSIFWRNVLQSNAEPLVVFSNTELVGRPATGLRPVQPGDEGSASVFDLYTGVGEAISIHELDEVFTRLHRPIQVTRGHLVNWDEARNRDLVLVGSLSEDMARRQLPLGKEFRFQIVADGPRKGDVGIVNLHPGPNEPPVFFSSPGLPVTEDYAVAELAPGLAKGQILMLAGTTTFGTQGAVEFMCDPDRLHDLLPRIRNSAGELAPFSALLRIKVNRGIPVEDDLVALRRQ